MGYSRKNPNSGWGYTYLKTPWDFLFFYFIPGISDKTKLNPWIFHKIVLATSLGNSKAKNKEPWKFQIIFSWAPLEIPLQF